MQELRRLSSMLRECFAEIANGQIQSCAVDGFEPMKRVVFTSKLHDNELVEVTIKFGITSPLPVNMKQEVPHRDNQRIQERRDQVLKMYEQGILLTNVAHTLGVSKRTVAFDVKNLIKAGRIAKRSRMS